jgi:hypothetical protein
MKNLRSVGATYEALNEHVVGNGQIVWLKVSPVSADLLAPHALRDLHIEETGTVAQLRARNRTAHPVLLPSDLVVGGGKQTRTIERSVVLAANSDALVPVRCVERQRWSPGMGSGKFRVEGTLSYAARTTFFRAKDRALTDTGTYYVDQQRVWSHVREELEQSCVGSPTESYADLLRATRPPAAHVKGPYETPPDGANGIALRIGRAWAWVEAFATGALLRAQADALLDDFRKRVDPLGAPCPRASDAIADAWSAPLVPIEAVDGTLGDSCAVRGEHAVGAALFLAQGLAHVAVTLEYA